MDYLRAAAGLLFIVGLAYLFSGNRRAVDWRLVVTGVVLQLVFGLIIAKVDVAQDVFGFVSTAAITNDLIDGLAALTSGGHIYIMRGPVVVPHLLNQNSAATLSAASPSNIAHGTGNTMIPSPENWSSVPSNWLTSGPSAP